LHSIGGGKILRKDNKKSNLINCYFQKFGAISFFIGLILIMFSWQVSHPIYMPEIEEYTFSQFHPSFWAGITLTLIGLFFTGYCSKSLIIKALCASLFPVVLYCYTYFFPILASSDIGSVRAMFEIFNQVGVNSNAASYFQYPIYFSLNALSSEVLKADMKIISAIFFALFGLLLALYLFLYLSKFKKNASYQIAFISIPIYFIGLFYFLNYQWVPQTIALVFFFLLLMLFNYKGVEYKFLTLIVFTVLAFTHAFIPTIFLIFFGFYVYKNRELYYMFLLMLCIYSAILVYFTTFYFPVIAETFTNTIYSFGSDYKVQVSRSFEEPSDFLSLLISTINKIRFPLIWMVVVLGSFVRFIQKKIDFKMISLGTTSGIYLVLGFFYPILGLRALQILLIALVIGVCFFIKKWKKLTLIFIFLILILAVFGPMRNSYDQTHYQLDEEKNACSFLAKTIPIEKEIGVAIGHVNWEYFTVSYKYLNGKYFEAYLPGNTEFYNIFDTSIKKDNFILYNTNLGKEILSYGVEIEEINQVIDAKISKNKIYQGGKTLIISG